MLFSATTTKKTEDLVRVALKKEPIYIGLEDKNEGGMATVSGLEQGYVICPSEKRLLLLFTFLKKNRKKKVMVFFSSCMSVKFHNELFNYIDLPVMCIHVSWSPSIVMKLGVRLKLELRVTSYILSSVIMPRLRKM